MSVRHFESPDAIRDHLRREGFKRVWQEARRGPHWVSTQGGERCYAVIIAEVNAVRFWVEEATP